MYFQGTFQETIFPIRHGTVEASHCYDHNDSDSLFEEELLTPQRLPLLGQYPKIYSLDQNNESSFSTELQLNPLSERVLQWLDLSGKGKQLHSLTGEKRSTKESRKTASVDFRKPHVSRRRELPTRSLSVDVLESTSLTSRSSDAPPVRQRKPLSLVVATTNSAHHEDCQWRRAVEEPPVIQTFEPPRLLRPMTAWPPPTSPNRPQLHIFMPPLAGVGKIDETSEAESTIEQASWKLLTSCSEPRERKLNKNLCPSDSSIRIKTKSKSFIDTCESLRWQFATNLRCHQSYLCFTEWKMIRLIFSQTMINMYNTLFFQQESFFDGNSFEDGALSLLRTTSLYSETSVITYTFNLNYSAIS